MQEAQLQVAAQRGLDLWFPPKFQGLFRPNRYKIRYGGRGGAKSWSIARALIIKAYQEKHRIGCFRELQNSIKDSVHHVLCEQIEKMGLSSWFRITQTSIVSLTTGTEFIFKGLRLNAHEIKSMEGITIAWVEEAQLVSKTSWDLLIPTIRTQGSELWISFNPIDEEDDTWQRFVVSPPPGADVVKVNWNDNKWFPEVLEQERQYMLKKDPEGYEHVWGGECRVISDAIIFKNHYTIDTFDAEYGTRLFFGMDFGFANDAACLVRCYMTGEPPSAEKPNSREELWIEYAEFGYQIEIDNLPEMMDKVPGSRKWPIKADNSRPETISYLRRQGFNITAAEKWQGCVEDRIEHLRGFRMIHIHQRNKQMQQEARLYRYKVDKNTEQVLPMIVDANNHGWDATGYALDGYIQRRGLSQLWGRL